MANHGHILQGVFGFLFFLLYIVALFFLFFCVHTDDRIVFVLIGFNQIINPLGIKPQNINYNFNYADGSKNQLNKLIEFGYLENNLPDQINSTVDFNDTSKSLDLRVRSYFDANCAHCHENGGEASSHNLRFAFNETINPVKMGVTAHAAHYLEGYNNVTVTPGNVNLSILHYRINTENDLLYIMPPLTRTKRHTEAVQLIETWINSL
jgi:hypothetical protein